MVQPSTGSQSVEITNDHSRNGSTVPEDKFKELQAQQDTLKFHYESLEKENTKLKYWANYTKGRYRHIVERLVLPYAHEKKLRFRDHNKASMDLVLSPMLQDLSEVDVTRQRLHSLQHEMLSTKEKAQSVSDEQLAQNFRGLATLIKSLSRAANMDPSVNVVEPFAHYNLICKVSKAHWNTRPRKKYLLEAVIWSILIDLVFHDPFVILGEHCSILTTIWTSLFGTAHDNLWPLPSLRSETWRYTTIEQIISMVGAEAGFTENMDKNQTDLEQSVSTARALVSNAIQMSIQAVAPTANLSHLPTIVEKAINFVLQLSLQRCRLQVSYPEVGELCTLCEGGNVISIPDSEELEKGTVAFIVNPGLTKWGDAHGNKLDEKLHLVPSLVYLEQEDE